MIKNLRDKWLNNKTDKGVFGEEDHKWTEDDIVLNEGELSIDVYQDKDNIIVKSTIAGVKPEDLDISIINDLLTIRGERKNNSEINEKDYLYQECYWGSFSRSVILPAEVEAKKIKADLEDGILTITLKKIKKADNVKVKVNK